MTPDRFRDPGTRRGDVEDDVLVECPACGRCAVARWHGDGRRATCGHCAWTRDEPPGERVMGGPGTWFALPLWLRTPLGDHELWAFNAAHLDLIAAYAGATLRERAPREGARAATLVEKLPGWLKTARRDDVLAAVERLRARLREA